VVVHSTTKYVGGHSDVVGGALVVDDTGLAATLAYHQNAMGAVNGPFDAWLTLRGIKTLAVRMERHCDNAERIVGYLSEHPAVASVLYPGLESHSQYALAQRQARGFGGMLSFELDSDLAGAKRFLEALRIFALAESLGGVESLIEHPALMTHASVPAEMRAQLGISDALIRISAGIENIADLLADLTAALAVV